MLAHTAFSLSEASPSQIIAFFGGAVVTVAFCGWVVYLVRQEGVAGYLATAGRRVRQGDLS